MLESDEVRLLTDVGFIAVSHGFDREALAIFDGVTAARPTQEAGQLGVALVHLLRGETDQAIAVLKALGPSDAALTFLALARSRKGEVREARDILQDVARTAGDASYSALATDLLAAMKT